MARNDVFLNINALSPADAVVTGQQDMTAATVPELVLGDTPTFNFYFTDNTNVWPSWAGNAAYTVTWALSDAVSGDFSPAATTGNATPITGGWSVVLPLNAYDLVGLLNTKRVSQPYPVTNLWQQIRVADPSGNEVTRAMFWTPVRYRAISDTQNTESASPTGGREVTVDNVNVLTTPTAAQFYAANPVPTSALGSAANGELLIGNGTGFTKSTLTAGTGITVTNGSGSITIDASGAQETLTATVKNAESVAITKGQVVYLFGATGNMPSVKLAYNTSDATSAKTFGVVSDTSIAANGTGTVTCVGVVDGLNLGAYNDGDTLYLGATPGSVTATKPYAPNHLVYVGIVERANAGNGELYVKVQNGYELDEIHDVQINSPRQSGQTLIYDNTTSLWKNARITAGSNIAVTNGDGSISIGFSGTLPVANGGTGVTTSTGSGSVVLSASPTLTTPILGTPQSGTLSSCTGLPISTGVSGLGANIATFLATPSSANLASAVTDETGTGALVFANTPTLVTPVIGAATGTSLTVSGNVTASDAILGTSGPSVKSTLSARAPRQGLVYDGTTNSSATLTSAIGTSDFTVSVPFTVPASNPSGARGIFSIGNFGNAQSFCVYIGTGGALDIVLFGATGGDYRASGVNGFVSANAGKTGLLTITRSSTTLTVYFNGVSQTLVAPTVGGVDPTWAGTLTSTSVRHGNMSTILYFYVGYVGDLDIYNRALSASEVVSLYEAGAPSANDIPGTAAGTAIASSAGVNVGNVLTSFTSSSGQWQGTVSAATTPYVRYTAGRLNAGNVIRISGTVAFSGGTLSYFGVTQQGSGTGSASLPTSNGNFAVTITAHSYQASGLIDFYFAGSGVTVTVTNLSITPLGLLLAPDAAQAGGGLVWYDTSGNAANITLPASGVSWNVPSSRVLGGNWNATGTFGIGTTSTLGTLNVATPNLTYGTVYLNGATTTADFMRLKSTGADGVFGIESSGGGTILTGSTANSTVLYSVGATALHLGTSGTTRATLTSGGNYLIGTTTDGGQKLQVSGTAAVSSTLSVGGTTASQQLHLNVDVYGASKSGGMRIGNSGNNYYSDLLVTTDSSSNPFVKLSFATHQLFQYAYGGGNNSWTFYTNNTTALTLSGSDQSATFAGSVKVNNANGIDINSGGTTAIFSQSVSGVRKNFIYYDGTNTTVSTDTGALILSAASDVTVNSGKALKLGNAYVAGAPTATGYVTIKDSAGTTYKVLVGT